MAWLADDDRGLYENREFPKRFRRKNGELSENYLIVFGQETERKQVGTRELSRGTLYMLGDQQRNN